MKMRRVALLLIPIALLLTGCWDYRDLETRAFVQGVAIDSNPEEAGGGFIVTVENPHPKGEQESGGGGGGGGGSTPPKIIVSEAGPTVSHAFLSMSNSIERSPLWSQLTVAVISDEVAREGIGPILDLFLRSVMLNTRARLYIAEGSDAREVLTFEPKFQPITARFLRGLEDQFTELPRFAEPQDMHSFNRPNNEGALLVPRISLSGDQLVAEGAAVLERGRLVGWLDGEAAEGANWLLDNVIQSILQVPCPGTPQTSVTLRVRSRGNRLQTVVRESLPRFTFRLFATARIVDLSGCSLVPSDPSERRQLEQAAASVLERRARVAITSAQDELGADFLELGVQIQRNHPEMWPQLDWDEQFPEVPVSVAAEVSIRDIGSVGRPLQF